MLKFCLVSSHCTSLHNKGIYIYISIETYLGVIVRLFYSLFGVRWSLAKVFPGLQTIRRDLLRPFCTLLGTFLGLPGFVFALVFNPIAQVSFNNVRRPLEFSSAPPTPSRYNIRNLVLQLHVPVTSDVSVFGSLDPSEFITIIIYIYSLHHA